MGYSWIISGCLEQLGLRGFWFRGWGSAVRVWSQHKVLVGMETHPGRSHRCITANTFRDHPERKQFRVWFPNSFGHLRPNSTWGVAGFGFLRFAGVALEV